MNTMGIFKPGTTEELGYNEEGEICITGPALMLGYLNNPAETEKIMVKHPDGKVWIHSGDLGSMDEDEFETDSATVGGWTLERFGAFPKAGESFEFENLKVTVLKMDGMRVERVRVEVKEP